MYKDSIIDFLGFIIVKVLGAAFCCLPLGLSLWIGRRIGGLAHLFNSKRRSIAYANVKSAFPEKGCKEIKRIVKAHYRNLGMSIVELFKVPVMGKRYVDRHVTVKNIKRIQDALDRGKGVLMVAAHFGNWEIGSLAINAHGYRMSIFVREQKYTRLNNLLDRYREKMGSIVVAKGFSIRDVIKALKNNGIVAMLSDQDAGANGVFVNFFNRPASAAPGAVSLSLRTGSVMLPSLIRRVGFDRHELVIGEALNIGEDVKANLEKIAAVLEHNIKNFPEQWLWPHKRWKSSPQRTIMVLSDGKAGHLNQAMAVAGMVEAALCSRLEARGIEEKPIVKIKTMDLRFKNRFTRVLLDFASLFAGRRCQGCLQCLKFCLDKGSFEKIRNTYADMIISCGASTAAANIFMKYENNAKGVVIMKPGLGRSRKFDIVILPRHDVKHSRPGLNLAYCAGRGNMLITEAAPNKILPSAFSFQPSAKGIGLLIGGNAKNFELTKEAIEKVIDGVLKIANEMDCDIFVTTSRRTSPEIDSYLKDKLSNNTRCKLLVIANEKNPEGTVAKILDSSEVVIVSPESISMISEAASSGRHVLVFKVKSERCKVKDKYQKSITGLEEQGYIKIAALDEVYSKVRQILTKRPAVKRLDDRKGIVEGLKAIV
ncbi:MAG: mitochondrial fission ELM1 family protein [Candidatus Omnitrophica bacterium]|nr:mitochondrial fission ELM1 family protein [Candidatus Omnitrophota bacterium]